MATRVTILLVGLLGLVSVGFVPSVAAQSMTPTRAGAPGQGPVDPPPPVAQPPTARTLMEQALRRMRNMEAMVPDGLRVRGVDVDEALDEAVTAMKKAVDRLMRAEREDAWVEGVSDGLAAVQTALAVPAPEASALPRGVGERYAADRSDLQQAAIDLAAALARGPGPDLLRTRSAQLLPAATVASSDTSTQLAIQAGQFFFSNRWRLYVRSTVTVEEGSGKAADESGQVENAGEGAGEDAAPDAADLEDRIRLALQDPYGGLLNVSTGYFRKLPTRYLSGDANDLEHGLFFDGRVGMRFLDLSGEQAGIPSAGGAFTGFYSTTAGLRLVLPLFFDRGLERRAGGFELATTWVSTAISNRSASSLFQAAADRPAVLPRVINSVHLSTAISLPAWANIEVSGILWSNADFQKKFMVGVNLIRADAPQSDGQTAPAAPTKPAAK